MRRLFFLSILLFVAPALRAESDFRVVSSSGSAAVWPAGADAPSPATDGLPLNAGDRLITGRGGSLELAAPNGTLIRLEEKGALSLEDSPSRWTAFRLQLGRLIAKFAPSPDRPYRVVTPVAVAAIRGTELVLDVAETGKLEGGVVEGEVAFEPLTESETPPADESGEAGVWSEQRVATSEGIQVEPNQAPRRLAGIPPLLTPALASFPSIRERVPKLRDNWRMLPLAERESLRRGALRERIRWDVPRSIRDRVAPARPERPAPVRPVRPAPPSRVHPQPPRSRPGTPPAAPSRPERDRR